MKRGRDHYRFRRGINAATGRFWKPEFAKEYYFGTNSTETSKYKGIIKCKMMHKGSGSIIMPDQIFLCGEKLLWFQPLSFMANMIVQDESTITCMLPLDIAGGHVLRIKFQASGFLKQLSDYSQIFDCEILGPKNLENCFWRCYND